MNTQTVLNTLCNSLNKLSLEELRYLKQEIESRLENTAPEIDWLDTEYMEKAGTEADDSITLESVRKALAKIPGSMSDYIISEREDRV